MVYRVIQWATGTVGIHAVPAIVRHPDLELVGLWVHSDSKVGRDAGEICGIGPVGVTATNDVDALLVTEADVISYMASSDVRPAEVVDDLCQMLSAGFNVVNTSFVPLLFPWAAGEGVADQIRAACSDGGTSIYTSGIDPGFANVQLPISAMSLNERVDSVRIMEIVNYATWDNPFTLFEIMGFGKTDESQSLLLAPGSLRLAWGPVIETIAAALDADLEEIVEKHEVIRADEAFEIASGKIDAGTISGVRFEVQGIVSGRPAIVVEHVTRMRDEDAPDWPQGSGYRVLVDGEPQLKLELSLDSQRGDHNTAGCLATAMCVLNAVPHVVNAEPGIVTALDLPVYTATGLMS